MTEKRAKPPAPEPMGIVISSGRTVETPPKFSAYVWGPAPEETKKTKAHAA
ncbi:MAG TPA: hypothetical protein VNA89_04260 [Gemmatimonadaceae bacterium]|nr:hypothetical protein [Gemmatimonadaceae bacterium]